MKNVLKFFPKSEKMLKFCSKVNEVLESAGNVKIVLQIRESAEKVPSAIGTDLLWRHFCEKHVGVAPLFTMNFTEVFHNDAMLRRISK